MQTAIGAVAVTAVATAFLILTPLVALLYGSFRTGGLGTGAGYTLQNWRDLLSPGIVNTLHLRHLPAHLRFH